MYISNIQYKTFNMQSLYPYKSSKRSKDIAGQYGGSCTRSYTSSFVPKYSYLPARLTQTTLNADCIVDENRDAMVWEANCWICFFASGSKIKVLLTKNMKTNYPIKNYGEKEKGKPTSESIFKYGTIPI